MSISTKIHKLSGRLSKPLIPTQANADDKESLGKAFALPTDTNILDLGSREEYKSILKEVINRVIIFEFFAQWCGPCRMLTVKLKEIAEKYKETLLIIKIDVDEYEDLAVEMNISAIPTYIIMKDKRVVKRIANSSTELLEETLEKVMGIVGDDKEI